MLVCCFVGFLVVFSEMWLMCCLLLCVLSLKMMLMIGVVGIDWCVFMIMWGIGVVCGK